MMMPTLPSNIRSPRGIRAAARLRAFSLIELLVVCAIFMAVVALVSLPGVSSLSKSNSRQSAASLTLSMLDQARSLALSQSSTYYLVFADNSVTVTTQGSDLVQPYAYRAFAIFQENYNTVTQNYDRLQVTPWAKLPDGVAFDPDLANGDTVFCNASAESFYCQPVSRTLTLPCFKFNSLGGLDEPTNATLAQIKICEGYVNPSGVAVITNRAKTASEELITVSLMTGRAKRLTQ